MAVNSRGGDRQKVKTYQKIDTGKTNPRCIRGKDNERNFHKQ